MSVNDDTWARLLGHIREGVLLPVVGPDLTVVNIDGVEQTLTSLIVQRLAEKHKLTASRRITTMDQAVAALRRKPGGQDALPGLYRDINDIIKERSGARQAAP